MTKLQLPPAVKYTIGIAIALVVWAVIGVGIGLVEMYNTAGAQATGTFTFSGNVSNGELVNITNGASVYRFEFNTTGNGSNTAAVLTGNAIRINLSMEADLLNVRNTSILASGNLTAAINANASTAALVTAANTTNLTTLTADTAGLAGNDIILSDNAVNIASSAMSGGATPNPTPTIIMTIARLAVAIFASLGVMIRFIE